MWALSAKWHTFLVLSNVPRVLYISYDGLLEPLGQSQVLQYLTALARHHQITLITYEKPVDWSDGPRRSRLLDEVREAGIRWKPLRYHRSPSVPATAYDLCTGAVVAAWLTLRHKIQIVHARSYVPSVLAVLLKKFFGTRYIFDMRGFWPDEKVDAGTWQRNSAVYRWTKRFEAYALRKADVIVSLTSAGADVIRGLDCLRGDAPHIEVIPTCVNLQLFSASARALEDDQFVLGYVGNVAGWYHFGPVLDVFQRIATEHPHACLRILNRGQRSLIMQYLAEHDVRASNVEISAADFRDVPSAMRSMHATCFFIKPVFSKLASAPTKLAEFLACGVPCMVNDGVGDMGRIVREEGVGVVVTSLDVDSTSAGAWELMQMARDPVVRTRCVETAKRLFSLESGVAAYERIYQSLAPLERGT